MYLTLGRETVVDERKILGIFDLDNCSQSAVTREFLKRAETGGRLRNTAEDIPNTFLLCEEGEESTVLLAQAGSRNLEKKLRENSL